MVHGTPQLVPLFPSGSGYAAVAGKAVNSAGVPACASIDPGSWTAGTVAGKALAAGTRSPAAAATARGTAGVDVRTAQVGVALAGPTSVRVVSAPAAAGTGDPGCSVPMTYTWDALPASGAVTLGVPFGSWTVQEKAPDGTWVAIPPARLTAPTNAAGPAVSTPVVTLDPRPLA
ncbi:hypothetical protein GCM10025866_10280 [Naasia aerilata]|uniref:Uncharacterized protein n=1 Tax=Naasia aerilata TaxID=1162966 RepID=A0ABN6XJT0_9MICO|nr:hypothetical protein GCM10025866_10280 [Naasia aerilata]